MSVWRTEFSRPKESRQGWANTGILNYKEPKVLTIEEVQGHFWFWDYDWIVLAESQVALGFHKTGSHGREYMAVFTESPIGGDSTT